MGIPLHSVHEPSVPTSSNPSTKEPNLQDLVTRKDSLEEELKALGSVLDSHNVTMQTSLTTFDGYPRSDIDVPQIRTTRARIIRLRNDHKALMAQIEKGLEAHFAKSRQETGSVDQGGSEDTTTQSDFVSTGNTFAKVNTVELRSPAQSAGLRAGDRIEKFGDADWLNNEKLSRVAQIVQQNEGRAIDVRVLRTELGSTSWISRQLILIPKRGWGGRGLLGCHLVPE